MALERDFGRRAVPALWRQVIDSCHDKDFNALSCD